MHVQDGFGTFWKANVDLKQSQSIPLKCIYSILDCGHSASVTTNIVDNAMSEMLLWIVHYLTMFSLVVTNHHIYRVAKYMKHTTNFPLKGSVHPVLVSHWNFSMSKAKFLELYFALFIKKVPCDTKTRCNRSVYTSLQREIGSEFHVPALWRLLIINHNIALLFDISSPL